MLITNRGPATAVPHGSDPTDALNDVLKRFSRNSVNESSLSRGETIILELFIIIVLEFVL